MTVKYIADIRRITGYNQEHRTKAAPTLRALLTELAEKYGAAFENRVFEGDRLSDTIIVLVNGTDATFLSGLDTRLSHDDVVAIFPMVAICG